MPKAASKEVRKAARALRIDLLRSLGRNAEADALASKPLIAGVDPTDWDVLAQAAALAMRRHGSESVRARSWRGEDLSGSIEIDVPSSFGFNIVTHVGVRPTIHEDELTPAVWSSDGRVIGWQLKLGKSDRDDAGEADIRADRIRLGAEIVADSDIDVDEGPTRWGTDRI